MLQKTRGSNDGINTSTFKEGEVYTSPQEISESLVKVFLENNWAEKVEEEVFENKAIEPSFLEDYDIVDLDDEIEVEEENKDAYAEIRSFVRHRDVEETKEEAKKADKVDKKKLVGKKKKKK